MGINPTPTNHRSFTFDGKSTREFGVYITGKDVFNAPERAVEMISIPGRDGEYALDQGHFNNIEVTYRAGIVADSTTDFAEAISNFRNWLASREGYCRLTDEYNTEEYRMAVFKNAIALEHEGLLTGEFDVTFDCKPQRYLAIGEELTEIGAWGNTETAEGEVVTIDASSDTAVKALTADIDPIQDLNGYDAPWVGGAGKNILNISLSAIKALNTSAAGWTWNDNVASKSGVSFTIQEDTQGNIIGVTVNGTNTTSTNLYLTLYDDLASSGAFNGMILNGCPSGGGYNSFGLLLTNVSTRAVYDHGSGVTIDNDDSGKVRVQIVVVQNYTANNLLFKPMVRANGTDATFAPYENICPISGHDEVDAVRTGKNLIKVSADSYDNSQACTSTVTDSGITVTATGNYARRMDAFNVVIGQTYTISFKGKSTGNNNAVYFCKSANLSGWNDRYSLKLLTATETEYTYTFTATTSVLAIGFYVTSNSSSGEMTITDLQLERGSTPTSYEPYNGTTYTTTLPSTTYGGTLDIVSGLLTVDRAITTYDGTESWYAGSSNQGFYRNANDMIKASNYKDKIVCNRLQSYDFQSKNEYLNADSGITGYYDVNSAYPTQNWIYAKVPSVSSVTDFRAWLSANPLQVVCELATPLTYQLTPTQVQLLLGENNIFADSGNVTVEYGHNPTLLTNPTWFPSKPLLQVWGYGDINLGNNKISINSTNIGNVIISGKKVSPNITLDLSMLNIGDSFYVRTDRHRKYVCNDTTTTSISSSAIISNTNCQTVRATHSNDFLLTVMPLEKYVNNEPVVEFIKGTAKTLTSTVVFSLTIDNNGTETTTSVTAQTALAYDGANTVSLSSTWSPSSITGLSVTYNQTIYLEVTGYSTMSALGNPIYIDLDIGEAYKTEAGEVISVNNAVEIPAELPTLPSGDTEVTYDNTITKVEVQPNYWKV